MYHIYYECYQPLSQILRTVFSDHIVTEWNGDSIKDFVQHSQSVNVFPYLRLEKEESLINIKKRIRQYQECEDTERKWIHQTEQAVMQVQELVRRANHFSLNEGMPNMS